MAIWDYLILIAYFIFSFGIAIAYSKRSGKSINDYFLSGRNLPWYLAGISLVATTFAADTPLAVNELVAKNGIAGNWIWWNFAFGGMLTVFFFAKLWRRAGILTEAEFAEIRYSGKSASFLRGMRAVYLGLFMNVIIIGWVNKAMASILIGMFGVGEGEVLFYVFGCMVFVGIYSALSGLWGVVITDAFQFIMAMTGSIILAVIVLNQPQVGGLAGMTEKLPDFMFNFFPEISADASTFGSAFALTAVAFIAYIGIQWWASWYPGAEPGGGGYAAQRMMSAKDEKHSLLAVLFFQVAHYAVRPWPWIIVGLGTLLLYPGVDAAKGMTYVYAMRDYLPVGLKGLLVAAFFAAYMSTIATHLNWGSSYLINDLYKRFILPNAEEKKLVAVSRVTVLLLMLVSLLVTLVINSISGAWAFILECGAGVGSVLILRWYWWRINAWSEISAMATPFVILPIVKLMGIDFPVSLFYLVGGTTVVWIVVTFLTKPVDDATLESFYRRVYPGGILWKRVSDTLPDVVSDSNFGGQFLNWICGIGIIYSALFAVGSFLFSNVLQGLIYICILAVCSIIVYSSLVKNS